MDILAKMKDKEIRFEELKGLVNEQKKQIQGVTEEANKIIAGCNAKITEIEDEAKRLQGEYRLLVEFGQEAGLIDADGNIIEVSAEVAAAAEESK